MPKTFDEQFDHCPYCKGTNMQNSETFLEGNVSIKVECEDCGHSWWEVFEFAFTELFEE